MSEPADETTVPPPPLPTLKSIESYPMWLLVLVVGIAVLGDALLREMPWRLNIALWVIALCWGGVGITTRYSTGPLPWAAKTAFLAAGLFGLLFFLRDAGSVLVLAMAAVLCCAVLGMAVAHGFRWTHAGLLEYPPRVANTFRIMNETGSRFRVGLAEVSSPGFASSVRVILRGGALALPFLAVFGFLFARADARFLQIFNPDMAFEDFLAHVCCLPLCGLIAWVVLTTLHARAEQRSPTDPLSQLLPLRFGAVEVCVAVGLIVALFGMFVAIQLPYLFGGDAYMKAATNLTAAGYARRGFFEMVTASAIALFSVYFLDWLTRDEDGRARHVLHLLIQGLLLLVLVVLLSAAHRMYVYIHNFGLTESRLWTLVFMAGLAVLLLWMALTVLRNRRDQFASGALVVALACVGVYGLINPHALIAEVNVRRAREGKAFDVKYAAELSRDAVPALVKLWATTDNPSLREELRTVLRDKKALLTASDWRTWNVGIRRAKLALKQVK